MRLIHHTTRLGFVIASALLVACSSDTTSDHDAESTQTGRPSDHATAPATTPPDGTATLDARSIHYVAKGWDNTNDPRQCVVLVHGWASDVSVWNQQIDVLAEHTRVIALDLPGHGLSELPARPFSMDLFADAIAAVMDDAGIDAAVLVGHSNGTPTIRQFYRDYPKRTIALVIVEGGLKSFISPQAAQPFLDQLRAPEYKEFVKSMIESMLKANPNATPEERRQLEEMALRTPQETLVGAMKAGVDPAIWTDDPINVPTLIVLADAPYWTDDYETFVRSLVPDVEYHKLEGVSHFLMIEDPQTFNALLLDYLRRIDFIEEPRDTP